MEIINEPEEEIPVIREEMEMNELERQEAEDSGDGSESHGTLELELKLSDGERERLERGLKEREGKDEERTDEISAGEEENTENIMRLEKPLAEFTSIIGEHYGAGWVQVK